MLLGKCLYEVKPCRYFMCSKGHCIAALRRHQLFQEHITKKEGLKNVLYLRAGEDVKASHHG